MSTRALRSTTADDAEAVLTVVVADDLHEIGRADADASDVEEWWGRPGLDQSRDTWLLEDGGQPVGYAQVVDDDSRGRYNADAWMVDEHDEDGFRLLMDAVGDRCLALSAEHERDHCELLTWAVLGREPRASWLTALGFSPARRFYRMEVELDPADPTPEPTWPDGTTVERVGPREAVQREYHAMMSSAFADHWGHVALDFETWLARHSASPNLDWDTVWLVRVDGVPAAGLKMRLYDDIAWIDTVGTGQDFRGRGLAGLLLRTAFAESLRRGQPKVELGVDTENATSALAVYERAGMSVAFAHEAWSMQLS